MDPVSFQIRRIQADEWHRLRALRLQGLADAPMAFASTLAREEAFPDDAWRQRATNGAAGVDSVTFIAEQDGRWIGLATGILGGSGNWGHAFATVVGMFVDGSARQRGIAAALVERIADWARDRGGTRVVLWVTSDNEAAIALYHRCGFKHTGSTRSVVHEPTRTECEMMRDLE